MKTSLFLKIYKNKKVLVTGSTGFKGSWLCFWLSKLGSNVIGIGLKPEKGSILFKELKLRNKIKQHYLDITNFKKLNNIIKSEKPDIIFHLAAQSIVSKSYEDPLKTFNSNILGSANILETVKNNKIKALVYITSDKCYLNLGKKKNYKEKDILGGHDNYSSSKASAELLFHSYFHSFFKNDHSVFVASARAGNVIGGGDLKENRIVPDFFKSFYKKKKLVLRNPEATRPWQHVLEPLSGYLKLGSYLLQKKISKSLYPSWNFGPQSNNCKPVKEIVNLLSKSLSLKKINFIYKKNKLFKEDKLLSLNITKAKKELGWKPKLSLTEAIDYTVNWYKYFFLKKNVEQVTEKQISMYSDK